jgi:hypothetical protein
MLAELINEDDLLLCPVFGRSNHHERDTASRRRFPLRDALSGDAFGPAATKLGNDPFDQTL